MLVDIFLILDQSLISLDESFCGFHCQKKPLIQNEFQRLQEDWRRCCPCFYFVGRLVYFHSDFLHPGSFWALRLSFAQLSLLLNFQPSETAFPFCLQRFHPWKKYRAGFFKNAFEKNQEEYSLETFLDDSITQVPGNRLVLKVVWVNFFHPESAGFDLIKVVGQGQHEVV